MNIGNQVKIASASKLLGEHIIQENAIDFQRRIQVELLLLRHGLGLEKDHSEKILVEQVIALLEKKKIEIAKLLTKNNPD